MKTLYFISYAAVRVINISCTQYSVVVVVVDDLFLSLVFINTEVTIIAAAIIITSTNHLLINNIQFIIQKGLLVEIKKHPFGLYSYWLIPSLPSLLMLV
ncbi:hypothetical protein Lalb_Chr22g0350381 [Lupinus albus]|uniref:Uncharacterized protein n=1 Tax=Lupinus albus TaxID=3870 RepID=A0A6A4NK97_LUPAL|nr:hypothetical protein Lalb_Chr22g0350381 [Lupinus albus]